MADDGDGGKVVNNTNDNPLGVWSDMLLQGPIGNVNELSGSSTTTNSASAALSREEKEAILQQFEKQVYWMILRSIGPNGKNVCRFFFRI